MDKKGKLIFDELVKGVIVVIVIVTVILIFYGQLWSKTREGVEGALPEKEGLVEKFYRIIKGENLEFEAQQKEANKIINIIRVGIDGMENDNDCIEEIDFSDADKDFIVEFKKIDGWSRVEIYKMVRYYEGNLQPSYVFGYNFGNLIYYFFPNKEDVRFNFFRIENGLGKVFEHEIVWFLYKDKDGRVGFFSKDDFDDNFKYKQICSTGEYYFGQDCDKIKLVERKDSKIYITYITKSGQKRKTSILQSHKFHCGDQEVGPIPPTTGSYDELILNRPVGAGAEPEM